MVGLDLGKRSVATMVDQNGVSLRYTSRQRSCESGLAQYSGILLKEKEGVEELETELSLQSARTIDEAEFLPYLRAKQKCDAELYRDVNDKWRRWKFRLFCRRKSSEDLFLNSISAHFGPDCTEEGQQELLFEALMPRLPLTGKVIFCDSNLRL